MTNRVNASESSDRDATETVPVPCDGTETVECYEVDEDVVLYDAENPLAWIESDTALDITEMV